jgi:hypothetical protein
MMIFLACLFLQSSTPAFSATVQTVTSDSARVYASPSEASRVLGRLKKGTKLRIEGSAGDDFVVTKVKMKGVPTNAYLKQDQLSGASVKAAPTSERSASTPPATRTKNGKQKKRIYVGLTGGIATASTDAFNEGGGGVIQATKSSYSLTGGGLELGYELEPQVFVTAAIQYFSGKVDWLYVTSPSIVDQIEVNTLAVEGGADYYFLAGSPFQVGAGAAARYYLSSDVTVSNTQAALSGSFSARSALDLTVRVTPQYSITEKIIFGLQGGYWISSKALYTGATLRYFL